MKLIKKTDKQRYYQLDFKIINTYGYFKTIPEIWEAVPIKLVEYWELAEDISAGVDKICVSDARAHIERLVFPAFYVRNKNTGETRLTHRNNTIDGKHTMMIHGGDYRHVYEDKVYVRHLRMING